MPPHVVTTSYLTHAPSSNFSGGVRITAIPARLCFRPARAIGLRLVPMERDLRFLWEEMPQQILDEQAQKVRQSQHAALIAWAKQAGEGTDYTDNVPAQCLHPVGHWYEVANLLRNGVLLRLLQERPNLRWLLVHNIDCLGVDLDPALLGLHIRRGACLSFEVITRRLEDRGGGLARVQGRPRILEGLAMPREEDEFALSYYNSLSTWIDLRQLLALFELTAEDLPDAEKGFRGDPPRGRAHADLHHAQGSQEEVGPRPGRHFPRRAIREVVGRHERAAGSALPVRGGAASARAATQRPRAIGRMACGTDPPRT